MKHLIPITLIVLVTLSAVAIAAPTLINVRPPEQTPDISRDVKDRLKGCGYSMDYIIEGYIEGHGTQTMIMNFTSGQIKLCTIRPSETKKQAEERCLPTFADRCEAVSINRTTDSVDLDSRSVEPRL